MKYLPGMLAGFLTIPLAFIVGGYFWQVLPPKLATWLTRWRFLFICGALPVGVLSALVIGPWIERIFFHGDFKGWLAATKEDPVHHSCTGGWTLLLLPLCAVGVAILLAQVVNPVWRRWCGQMNRNWNALADLGKFLAAAAVTLAAAFLLGTFFNGIGFDPRGPLVGTYVQRNALIVGFVMGFAIIPIIYTLADDALTAVPSHLRSASLGCGATQWQTAWRVVIPTAMSGLFSAVMVGLGRAVGETMIVLMAAGNTAVMELNPFNGLRTLSANIAVELQDAAADSTHFRVLFLAALLLFAMTFAVNTVAEIIRQRFRRRAYQL